MRPSRKLEKNLYARMPLEEAMAVVVQYWRGGAVVEEGQTPRNWFLPADCLPVEAPRIATALVLLSAYRRGCGEPWQTLEALHGDLARFSYLPDLDRANYRFTHRSESNAHPLDEAAYIAAQDRYTQIRAKLAEDWHAFELDGDYVPLYDYLPKELPLPELSYIRALTRDYVNVVCDRHLPGKWRLREWLPASKEMICRALAIEYVLLSERTEEDYKCYLGVAGVLGHFVDEAGPGLYDGDPPFENLRGEKADVAIAQNKLEMRIGGRAIGDICPWYAIFVLMLQAYEIRFGIRPLIEPATDSAPPSVTHTGSK